MHVSLKGKARASFRVEVPVGSVFFPAPPLDEKKARPLMAHQFLYTASGRPAAVLAGDDLFSLDGQWLGIQDEDGKIWDPEGYFLGVISEEDRLVRPKQPEGPPFFRSPRPPPSPPSDLTPPPPKEPVVLEAHLLDALEGYG